MVFDTERRRQRGASTGGGGLAVEEAFDYQQQGCSNVFRSVTQNGASLDKIGLGETPYREILVLG